MLKSDNRVIDAIAFRQGPLDSGVRRMEAVYRLGVNDYGQMPTVQLVVEYLRAIT